MTDLIELLNTQHRNIARLVHLIEHEIDKVTDEETPNVTLLLDIMQYLTRYVDVAHHPLEESLIACYEDKEAPENREVEECKRQHHQLGEMGREFMAVVEAVREEQLVERTVFARVGREFVEAQLAHIDLEEGKVFPALRQVLSEDEMSAVFEDMDSRKDPLFGGIVDKEYQQLYDYIIRSA